MALALLEVATPAEFHSQALNLIHKFPATRPWMTWWMQPGAASMLFESHRMMDIELWSSLQPQQMQKKLCTFISRWLLDMICHSLIVSMACCKRVQNTAAETVTPKGNVIQKLYSDYSGTIYGVS